METASVAALKCGQHQPFDSIRQIIMKHQPYFNQQADDSHNLQSTSMQTKLDLLSASPVVLSPILSASAATTVHVLANMHRADKPKLQ